MVCGIALSSRYLQIDHKVPFHVLGDVVDREPSNFMLLCGSCDRTKSWSCEECDNWSKKNAAVCRTCYWGSPKKYTHIATSDVRRVDITWSGDETEAYDLLARSAKSKQADIRDHIKAVLKSIHATRVDGDADRSSRHMAGHA